MNEGEAEHVIRVVVVDDEALVRSGFELILGASDDIEVVATAGGGEAVETVRRERPDVLLLDIRMPDVDGLTVLRELRTTPDAPVVAMLTTFDADEYILTALHSGAAGFLLKDTEPEQLANLVRTLAAGGVVLSPKASRTLLHSHPRAKAAVDEDAARVRLLRSALSVSPADGDVSSVVGAGGVFTKFPSSSVCRGVSMCRVSGRARWCAWRGGAPRLRSPPGGRHTGRRCPPPAPYRGTP
ncbi:response regulator [Streptomyces flaveolus]|uniref:response regulator n=1 Tax=Streptomyces flaveolus TaxID=67297 RepID=UPI001E2C04C8|nr:response regulator transcription factor [Streptomyces flaveolus]